MPKPTNNMPDPELHQSLTGLATSGSIPRPSSPDPTGSEANTSVQVQVDYYSNMDQSAATPSRAASRRPSPLRSLDLLSILGQQAIPEPSPTSHPGALTHQEDLLMGLISTSEPLAHGQKRPREAESDDEPLPKRDRLEEELEALAATHPMVASASGLRVASVIPTSAAPVASPVSPQDVDALHLGGLSLRTRQTVDLGTRRTLAARPTTRRLPGVTEAKASRRARHSSPIRDYGDDE
ncbi:hypothetical protein QBC38DRAFT_443329 [Podospora fimiseda]|uniref:Uncharacterized protein n=1 Tax=Podospora fimiseda TaxID=252190 RepID=A0AAN7BQW4_9PEZI|nr:hypothetical protein QBC38DRAFT_443329 [Podospora fimiseda]